MSPLLQTILFLSIGFFALIIFALIVRIVVKKHGKKIQHTKSKTRNNFRQ